MLGPIIIFIARVVLRQVPMSYKTKIKGIVEILIFKI